MGKSTAEKLVVFWEKRTAPLRWAIMKVNGVKLSKQASSQAEEHIQLAISMTKDGLVDSIMKPIWERHAFKKAIKYNDQNLENLTQDKNSELYKTSFYIRHLFQGPFGGKGKTNVAVHCRSCTSTIWFGDSCIKCNNKFRFVIFSSPICYCLWDFSKNDQFYEICTKAGYLPELMIRDHEE